MPGLRRALVALFVVGVLFAAVDVAIVLTSSHDDQKIVDGILGPLIGLSFIGTGVFAWWRRPLNRFGAAHDRGRLRVVRRRARRVRQRARLHARELPRAAVPRARRAARAVVPDRPARDDAVDA